MPELPEIETLSRELAPALTGRRIVAVRSYREGLREPFPVEILELQDELIMDVARRSKYLLLALSTGTILIHLGMSGQLRLVSSDTPLARHDHLDIQIEGGNILRLRDPRRFGVVLWEPLGQTHIRLSRLGPEPLSVGFNASYLKSRLAGRSTPIKAALMDASVVVGVGNIYASEALFDARISPLAQAGALTRPKLANLVASTRHALETGIALGGSSMRDYVHADGSLGGFLSQAKVYGRAGQPCVSCSRLLRSDVIAGRTSVWCQVCQKA